MTLMLEAEHSWAHRLHPASLSMHYTNTIVSVTGRLHVLNLNWVINWEFAVLLMGVD